LELKRLINFLDEVNIVGTFFVVPYEDESHSSVTEDFASCLRAALDDGHELALHGYRHTKNEFGVFYQIPLPVPFPTFKRQKERIKRASEIFLNLIGVKPKGFRAPYYLYNRNTLKALSSLGFTYDSSATVFKTAHCSSFRVRWLRNCQPFFANGVLEAPVTGDYTFNLENYGFLDSLGIAMRDFRMVEFSGGIFVINNHPHCFRKRGFQFLTTVINKLHEKTVFHTLTDVAQSLSYKRGTVNNKDI
jgi:peptidoglycan/xylan/chitin deacetylase (PgdA/CDA1 family)